MSRLATLDRTQAGPWTGTKAVLFLAILAGVLTVDLGTKMAVQNNFAHYQQVDIIGEYVRLTYIYNPGAAFGIELGPYSRQIFLVLSIVALTALVGMYWFTPPTDRVRLSAIALICGGAIGNPCCAGSDAKLARRTTDVRRETCFMIPVRGKG